MCSIIALSAFSQVSKNINLTTAGTLSTLLTPTEKTTITNLTITGNIDAHDVKCMRDEITKLAVLDISTVTIKVYSGDGGTESGSNYYSENEMPQYSFGDYDKGKTTLTSIKLPATLTGIATYSFANCTGLSSIIIPSSVIGIENDAFYNCTGLTTINIPANVIVLDYNFYGCTNLNSITVDAANTKYSSLGGVLFDKLQTVIIRYPEGKKGAYTIPSTVKTIANGAFSDCIGLTGSLTIPASLTTLSSYTFDGCIGLTAFVADAANPAYSSKDGVLFNKAQTEILAFPAGKTGRYVVPSSVTTFNDVSGFIGLYALTIPETVSNCDAGGIFEDSPYPNLKYLNVPAEFLNEMEYEIDVTAVKIPQIDTLFINSGLISDFAFGGIKYYFQNSRFIDLSQTTNTTLPKLALLDLNEMEELILPAGLTSLSYRSVAECVSLKSIQIPASVTEIGMRAFENCRSMTQVNFSTNSQLKIIDNWAFYACHGLKNIVIPTGVTSVGDGAFWGCEYLTNLSLPSTVQKINDSGFDGCIALNNIRVDAAIPPTVSAKTFNRVNRNATLYVPDASITQYKNAFGWKEFYNIKGISTQLEEVDTPSYGIRVSNNTIEITNAAGQNIEVFDISGRMLFTKSNVTDYQEVSIPQKGVYLLKIGAFKKKVMVN